MRSLQIAFVSGLSLAATLLYPENPARACGGCLSPTEQVTTVDSHRMVISLGLEETILWDQFIYSGSPEDFVWVLPVPSPEVVVELAEAEFFDELDGQTAPLVQPLSLPPVAFCPQGGIGCGAADAAADNGQSPTDGVTVYDQGVVGPYETATIGAEDPNAIYDWLDGNGYAITEEAIPALEHYIALGNAFVALRLSSGQDVQAMQPVRVRYPNFMGIFPLEMVVVGASGVLDMSLWIVAEQRYEARNYGTIAINEAELAWDWESNTSNYNQVFEDTVERAGNRAWVVEYAGALDNLALGGFADTELARNGHAFPYLTRLRTRMLVEHIDQDIELSPSANSSDVDNFHFAPIDLNRPPDAECDDGVYCQVGTDSGRSAGLLGGLMMLGVFLVLRRR